MQRARAHSRKQPGLEVDTAPEKKTDQENRAQKFHECVTDRALEKCDYPAAPE